MEGFARLHFEAEARDSVRGFATAGCSMSKLTARTFSGTASTGLMGLAWRDSDNSSGDSLDSSSSVASTWSGFSASVVRFDLRHAATAQQTMARTTSKDVVARDRPPLVEAWWTAVALWPCAKARQSAALRNVAMPATGLRSRADVFEIVHRVHATCRFGASSQRADDSLVILQISFVERCSPVAVRKSCDASREGVQRCARMFAWTFS